MEEAGIIAFIGMAKDLAQTLVGACPTLQSHQLTIALDTAILTDAQEDDPVDC
jgi:hypothetical protein